MNILVIVIMIIQNHYELQFIIYQTFIGILLDKLKMYKNINGTK